MKQGLLLMAAAALLCGALAGCEAEKAEVSHICGTIEEAFGLEMAPAEVREAMADGMLDERYEQTFCDQKAGVEVWRLMRLDDERSADGMGIVIVKDGVQTPFPDVRHGRQPSARFDEPTQTLWLTCGEMEGTAVNVERLYKIQIGADGSASIVGSIDPYDMQQALLRRLGYSIDGQNISFYDQNQLLCSVTDTVADMGGFDEEPIWIGEQLSYDLSDGKQRIVCLPGLKYVTGLVLNYDAMPTILADVSMDGPTAFSITNITVKE